jgi:hypothetical protein
MFFSDILQGNHRLVEELAHLDRLFTGIDVFLEEGRGAICYCFAEVLL